jgi:hypothetical protein
MEGRLPPQHSKMIDPVSLAISTLSLAVPAVTAWLTLFRLTSKRGRVIESMHVALSRNETHQNFNIWVYGERGKLVRGSGLFVAETGISADHHFLTPDDGNRFRFIAGHYTLDVFAHLLSDAKPIRLFSQALEISREWPRRWKRRPPVCILTGGQMHHATFRTSRSGHPPLTRESFCGS